MARPTKLKILGDRPVPPPDGAEDTRSVVEAFPVTRPVEVSEQSIIGQDVLEILRRSHDRIAGEARQAVTVATAAIEQATEAKSTIGALDDRASKLEGQTAALGQTMLEALAKNEADRATSKQMFVAASMGFQRLGERLAGLATFAIDRAPAFLSMGAAIWLWGKVLEHPEPLQLTALGLFGIVVVAPAIWLSSRR